MTAVVDRPITEEERADLVRLLSAVDGRCAWCDRVLRVGDPTNVCRECHEAFEAEKAHR